MALRCFAYSGPGKLDVIDGIINSAFKQEVLREMKSSRYCIICLLMVIFV